MRQLLTAHPRSVITIAAGLVVMLGVGVAVLYIGGDHTLSAAATRPTAAPSVSPSSTDGPTATASPSVAPTPSATPSPTVDPTPTPTPTPTPPSCVNVASMPISQQVNQLIMVSGDFSNVGASAAYARAGVGGFVFFGQPAAGSGPRISAGLAGLFNDARASGQILPWTSTDEEGGYVARLSNLIGSLPAPRWMAANWTPAHVQSVITAHARAMWNLGITMDLAPVVDTALPSNTIADEADRSFSFDPHTAATYGVAFANGLHAGGVVAVAKHFPGFGQANANTDLSPATDPSLAELQGRDLIPFEQAIANGVPVIMITHASVPGLTGSVPASLSPATYQYLRNTLHFNGVTLTDSLSAVAITDYYSQPAAAVKAVEAGADMVMIQDTAWQGTLTALQNAVASGALPAAQLNASVTRILTAKSIATC